MFIIWLLVYNSFKTTKSHNTNSTSLDIPFPKMNLQDAVNISTFLVLQYLVHHCTESEKRTDWIIHYTCPWHIYLSAISVSELEEKKHFSESYSSAARGDTDVMSFINTLLQDHRDKIDRTLFICIQTQLQTVALRKIFC